MPAFMPSPYPLTPGCRMGHDTMRKIFSSLAIILLIISLCACSVQTVAPESPTQQQTANLSAHVQAAQMLVEAFMQAWQGENHPQMYALLSELNQAAIGEEDFCARYAAFANTISLQSLTYQILSALAESPNYVQVAVKITYQTAILGTFTRSNVFNLMLEDGQFRLAWEDGLILPELRGGNSLYIDHKTPSRGNIYDRNGYALAAQTEAVALGLVPGELDAGQEAELLATLSAATGLSVEAIQQKYAYALPDWYVPIADINADAAAQYLATLKTFAGMRTENIRIRYYDQGGVAAQVLGYMLPINADNLGSYQRLGYRGDESVGYDGLEYWAEAYLAGKHGASLYVINPAGEVITRLAATETQPAQAVYTTLEKDLQIKLQRSMGEQRGSIVVMEIKTGKILAMVSNPSFDPNLFQSANADAEALSALLVDPAQPLYNRAAAGTYPLGSVFKIITMASALESGLWQANDTYNCGLTFTELPGVTLYDWTYNHGTAASGILNLPEGLMRSCNPWFWHIGLTLFNENKPNTLTDMARSFGLGEKTGIEIFESAGNIENPTLDRDNVQFAIGQGTMMVTPLQVVRFVAAVANGGDLYRPTLIESINAGSAVTAYQFEAVKTGRLPVSDEHLAIIQAAMRSVTQDPRGTAYSVLGNFEYAVAGKTGTAENPGGNPHAWFAGYTYENNPNLPDIAVVVMLENAGEGSVMAAPLFKRVVALYFSAFIDAGLTLPWEAEPYILPTPTETPTP